MGSSLVLQGGAAVTKTLKETITQTSHGFVVGDVVRWDGTLSPPKYTKARANTALNAEVAGVVNTVADANNFELTYHGYIEVAAFSALTDPVMFLSADTAGGLTASPPSAVGTVVKPVLTKNTNGSGYLVMNYLGTQIGGSSTVAVDEIQPVGTIMPYAGTAIPDTWLACDGASYAIADYPELYNRTRYTTGDRVPLHGYIIELGMNASASAYYSNLQIGHILLFADGVSPTSASYNNIGVVVSKTAPNIAAPGAYPVTVKILPKYDSTPTMKKFAFANHLVTNTTGIVPFTNETLATRVTGAAAAAHSSNASVVVHALCPDLRGRTVVGTNASGYDQTDGDAGLASAVGVYDLGQQGGEEAHILTTAEMPAHSHTYNERTTNTSVGLVAGTGNNGIVTSSTSSVGGNTPHNNMPPYLAVRYIIKAKPYTRAAIIDGVDIPYSSLLVGDLRSGLLRGGGEGEDLVFKTNTSISTTGTERMRLTNDGKLVVGYSSAVTTPNPLLVFGSQFSANYPVNAVLMDTDNPAVGKGGGIAFAGKPSTASDPASSSGRALFASIGGYKENSTDGDYAGYLSLNTRDSLGVSSVERVRITSTGDVGIRTTTPGATLDVNGTLRVGNFGGATNVMVKINNTATAASTPAVGCVIPLIATYGNGPSSNTTPLPPGTWFVYLNAVENGADTDEDVVVVMAKIWTVASGTYLRFSPTSVNPSSTNDIGIAYSVANSTAVDRTGTFVTMTGDTDAYFNSNIQYGLSTVLSGAGNHRGIVAFNSNSAVRLIHGYAMRIA